MCYVPPHQNTCQGDQGLGRQWTRHKIQWRERRGGEGHAEKEAEKGEHLYGTSELEACGVSPKECERMHFPSDVEGQPEEARAMGG